LVFAVLLYVFSSKIANYHTTVDEAWFRWKLIIMFDIIVIIYSLREEVKKLITCFGYKVIIYGLINYYIDVYNGETGWSYNDYFTIILLATEALYAALKNEKK
jgi:hypothetical protein